jgi:hypothetical protein
VERVTRIELVTEAWEADVEALFICLFRSCLGPILGDDLFID